MSDCRIYVACLASYNAGRLHGEWVDCDGKSADELQEDVNAILRASPCKEEAEEFAIHDHEGFGNVIGEYTPLAEVATHAEMIEKHGDAWIAYAGYVGGEPSESDFEESYAGTWDSERAFAENLVDDLGYLDQIPEHLRYYFDYDAFARDLFINDYWRDDDTGAVFRRC